MDAAPQIVNPAPVAAVAAPPMGLPGAGAGAPDDAGAFAAVMIAAAETTPLSKAGRRAAAEEGGAAVPEGGNELPFAVGLLPSALPLPAAGAGFVSTASVVAGPQAMTPGGDAPHAGWFAASPGSNAVAGAGSAAPPGQDPVADPVTAGPGAAVSRGPAAAGDDAASAAAVALKDAAPVAVTGRIVLPTDEMIEPDTEAVEPSPSPLPVIPRAPATPAVPREGVVQLGEPLRDRALPDAPATPVSVLPAAHPDAPAAPEVELPPATEATTPVSADSLQPSYAVATAPSGPRPADLPPIVQLSTPVANPGWSEGLADRVAWMVQQDLGLAHLKLNPPQLGPVEVRVQVSGDQAVVAFTAHNQQVREALEGASQRLRDLLGSQGFVNVQVDISQHAFGERSLPAQRYDESVGEPQPVSGPAAHGTSARSGRALLDAYA